MIKNEIIFWSLFLIFNYLQFLPNYIFNYQESDILPYLDKFRGRKIGFFASVNMDFFRYLIDVSILIFLVKFKIAFFPVQLVIIYYLLLFIFNFYHQLFWTIYEVYPVIYNDWSLMKTGLAILWRESKIKLILSIITGVLILSIIYLIFSWYLNFVIRSTYSIYDVIVSAIFIIIFTLSIFRFNIRQKNQLPYSDRILRFIVGFSRIYFNIKLSLELSEQELRIKSLKIDKLRKQPQFSLKHRPNIYFLFIESYGSILLQHEEMLVDFKKIYEKFEKDLTNNNWKIISNLSKAPSSSAFSWLCYSTFFYGYNISQHAHYERFLKNPIFYRSDNLLRIFNNQGYTTYFLNPIRPNPKIKIDYTYLTPFYAIDQWILYEQLNYSGDRYGYGDFPPDQYSINRAREIIEKNNPNPYILFFLTKNSHSPFVCPDKLIEDWKVLNHSYGKSNYGGGFLQRPTVRNYIKAMQYQLEVMGDFIINTASKDDIYFIIGDHQPPVLNKREKSGLNTPVHIIAKDSHFLEGFIEYGFRESLFDDSLNPVRHESMFSAILREFIKNYSSGYTKLPDYEPYGLQI